MTDRVILAVKFTPVSAPSGLRKAVGAFLRYVQYRDKHPEREAEPQDGLVDGMLRYVAHRDRAAGRARLFDAAGTVGDDERRGLAAFVARAAQATRPHLSPGVDGKLVDHRRAVYRFVISPEHADGLDLRRLTLAAVQQLEADAGGPVRWIAAEHRNTAHPHVHLIVAGFREAEPEIFRSLVLTKPRLARMKESLALEIDRQRGRAISAARTASAPARQASRRTHPIPSAPPHPTGKTATPKARRHVAAMRPHHAGGHPVGHTSVESLLKRVAAHYRAEAEREARSAKREEELER